MPQRPVAPAPAMPARRARIAPDPPGLHQCGLRGEVVLEVKRRCVHVPNAHGTVADSERMHLASGRRGRLPGGHRTRAITHEDLEGTLEHLVVLSLAGMDVLRRRLRRPRQPPLHLQVLAVGIGRRLRDPKLAAVNESQDVPGGGHDGRTVCRATELSLSVKSIGFPWKRTSAKPVAGSRLGRTTEAPLGPTRCTRYIGTSAAHKLPIGPRSTIVAIAMKQKRVRWADSSWTTRGSRRTARTTAHRAAASR